MTRIKDWKVEDLTSEQKEIHDAIINGPRGHVVGPLRVWLIILVLLEAHKLLAHMQDMERVYQKAYLNLL